VKSGPSGIRVVRYPISISLDNTNPSPGVFVRPLNIALGDETGASAVLVWTVRAPVICEPSFVHFGSVSACRSLINRNVRVPSSDGLPFRVLSVGRGEFLKVEMSQGTAFPSPPSRAHALTLSLHVPVDCARYLAGSLRIRIDRNDYPEVLIPWSAFVQQAEGSGREAIKATADAVSQPFDEKRPR